jgi:hypothetical protein
VGVSRFRGEATDAQAGRVPRFLVESYVASSPERVREACEHARATAGFGTRVGYVETTYLPGDETVLHLFDAPSAQVLERAARRSGLQFERIVQAVSDPSA